MHAIISDQSTLLCDFCVDCLAHASQLLCAITPLLLRYRLYSNDDVLIVCSCMHVRVSIMQLRYELSVSAEVHQWY
jgi:hypothetical protein